MLRRVVGYLAFGLVTACGGGDSPPGPSLSSLAGTWILVTVNGLPVPFVISQTSTSKSEIVSNVVTVSSTGDYTSVFQLRTTVSGQATTTTTTETGKLSLQGSTVRVQASGGGETTGTISGNTLTLTQDTFVLVFQKQ